uniref:Uncharacterized protein n=1 Tax=Oryza nivara TaxID=4536 RepID=A0A0E0GKW8_ORYNI
MPNNSSSGRRKNAAVLLLTNHSQGPGLNARGPRRLLAPHPILGPTSPTKAQSAATQQRTRPRGRRRSPLRGWIPGQLRERAALDFVGSQAERAPPPHPPHLHLLHVTSPRLLPRYLSPPPPPPSASHHHRHLLLLRSLLAASSSGRSSSSARARVPVPAAAHGSSPPACASDTGCEGVWKPADLGRSPPESGTGGGIQVADWVQHMLFLTLGV